MKKKVTTDTVIESLIADCRDTATSREKHLYREALRGLVRLAKSEQMLDLNANVDWLTDTSAARAARRQAKAILRTQRLGATADAG